MPSAICQPRLAFILIAAFMSMMLLTELATSHGAIGGFSSEWRPPHSHGDTQLVEMNSTLGFEKILAVNLPERTDKRDAMALAARLSNLTIDYVNGIKGESIPNKALPYLQEMRTMPENGLGSWRAHMNVIREVVEKGYSSVLILEDDTDWDIRIKEQLAQFAVGTRWLQGVRHGENTHSPYGDDWDVLWVGHCVDRMYQDDPRAFVIENDVSAPHYAQLYHENNKLEAWIADKPPHSRIIHPAGDAICTFAYAISQRGAQRVLYSLSIKELTGFFDNAMADYCRARSLGDKCFSAYPTYFYQHRAAGKAGKNSDNQIDIPEVTEARTDEIQWPVKMNFEKLLMGQTDFIDQYPDRLGNGQ